MVSPKTQNLPSMNSLAFSWWLSILNTPQLGLHEPVKVPFGVDEGRAKRNRQKGACVLSLNKKRVSVSEGGIMREFINVWLGMKRAEPGVIARMDPESWT